MNKTVLILLGAVLLLPAAAQAAHRDSGERITLGYSDGRGDSWYLSYADGDHGIDYRDRYRYVDNRYDRYRYDTRRHNRRYYYDDRQHHRDNGWRRAGHHDHASPRGRDRRQHNGRHERDRHYRR